MTFTSKKTHTSNFLTKPQKSGVGENYLLSRGEAKKIRPLRGIKLIHHLPEKGRMMN